MKTYIFGGSGHAREVFWLITDLNKTLPEIITVENFVVSTNDSELGKFYFGIEVINEEDYFLKVLNEKHNCILAIGDSKIRKKIHQKLEKTKALFPSLIHPSTVYDFDTCCFGKGVIIASNVTLTTNVNIGNFAHVNIASTLSHDVKVNDFCTISPGVNIAGNVQLGEGVFVGIGATIIEKVNICKNVIIGASSVVLNDIENEGTFVGCPVKKVK